MRIDEIRLKNFRKFEDTTISFHPKFNLLFGKNGSSKTAVLEALAIAMEGLAYDYERYLRYNPENDTQKTVFGIYLQKMGQDAYLVNNRLVISEDDQRFIDRRFQHEIHLAIFTQDETHRDCITHLICSYASSVNGEGLGYLWRQGPGDKLIHLTKKTSS